MNDIKIREFIRKRLEDRASVGKPTREELQKDIRQKHMEFDHAAHLAKARLTMGTYRYGTSDNHSRYDYRARLDTKLEAYDQTGNQEFLIDALNYCVLEFMHPNRTDVYFKAEDDNNHSNRGFDL